MRWLQWPYDVILRASPEESMIILQKTDISLRSIWRLLIVVLHLLLLRGLKWRSNPVTLLMSFWEHCLKNLKKRNKKKRSKTSFSLMVGETERSWNSFINEFTKVITPELICDLKLVAWIQTNILRNVNWLNFKL